MQLLAKQRLSPWLLCALLGCAPAPYAPLDRDGDGIADGADGDDDGDGVLDEDEPPDDDVKVGQSPCQRPTVGGGSPLIADFDGSAEGPEVATGDGRSGYWYGFPEAVALTLASAGQEGRALSVRAEAPLGEEAGIGAVLNARGTRSCAHNATAFRGVAFWVRGEGLDEVDVRIAQGWTTPVADGGTCLEDCYNHHALAVPVSATWSRVELPFATLRAAGWGQAVPFDPRQLTQLVWGLPKDRAFTLELDGLEFLPGGTRDDSVPPGYGTGEEPPEGAPPGCASDALVIDDLETPSYSAARWYAVHDGPSDAVSSELVAALPEGGHAVHAEGMGLSSVTLARATDDVGTCFTRSASGLTFRVASDAARTLWVRVRLPSNTPVDEGGTCAFSAAQCEGNAGECCYDYHRAKVSLTAGWQDVTLPFAQFSQEGFGRALDLTFGDALGIDFEFERAQTFDLWLDDLALVPGEDVGPMGEPCQDNDAGNLPFGSRPVAYTNGARLPAGASDQAVREAYNQWRGRYLAEDCGGTIVDTYSDTGAYTVSEAMGYGMILTAFMNDKAAFDGLWRVTRGATSPVVPEFMSWRLGSDCRAASESDSRSATDGDMDIAYGLLLADRQWGSGGAIDYRGEAYRIVQKLAEWGLSDAQTFIKLGDWVVEGSGVLGSTTRPSDFMPDHFRAFGALTGDARWTRALDNVYAAMRDVQGQMNGLLPDFVVNANGSPAPAAGEVLESPADGTYAVNACRVPFRVGIDFLMSGDERALELARTLTSRAASLASGSPGDFVGKYYPDGDSQSGDTRGALFYTGPLGVGAMAGSDQAWLDALWNYTRSAGTSVYYQDTLRLLSLIVMSGHWWSPHEVVCD